MADTLPVGAVTRTAWNAVPPKVINLGINPPVRHLYLTFTGTSTCTSTEECSQIVKDLQTKHMEEPLPDIKPNFLIGGDGKVYVGRGWVSDAELPDEHKDKTGSIYHISYIGPKGSTPTEQNKETLGTLVKKGIDLDFIVKEPKYHEFFN